MVCDSLGQKSLTGSWLTVEDDSLWWFDTDVLIKLWMSKWQLNCFLDLSDLGLKTTDISIRLEWSFIDFHDTDHGINFIIHESDNCMTSMIEQN